jgi:general secretion pathway protein B
MPPETIRARGCFRVRATCRMRGILSALLAVGTLFGVPAVGDAQDTPEMLAAMRASMPPVPEQVPTREELSPTERADLPTLRVDMHRWHANPAERFVITGGRRIAEGGVAGQELWLRQIRPDGLVLQFRQTFYLQPR